MIRYPSNFVVAICAGLIMVCIAGCAPTTHVTETTTTRQYDTTNPPAVAMIPVAGSATTTTTQFNNGTVQSTSTEPAPYAQSDRSTTTVTTNPNDGTVQKRTTTYSTPY
jgi:hypothetical protein